MRRGLDIFMVILILSSGLLAGGSGSEAGASISETNNLQLLPLEKKFKRKRFSSFDKTGGNADNLKIKPERGITSSLRHGERGTMSGAM